MHTWKTANAVVRHLEATIPGFDVRQVTCHRTASVEPRVRDDVGGWDW